jgi:uncharacterized cupin superfamily protein
MEAPGLASTLRCAKSWEGLRVTGVDGEPEVVVDGEPVVVVDGEPVVVVDGEHAGLVDGVNVVVCLIQLPL